MAIQTSLVHKLILMLSIISIGLMGNAVCHPLIDDYPVAIPLNVNSRNPFAVDPNNDVEDFGRPQVKRTSTSLGSAESCCPSVTEIIEPDSGKNRSGDLVELYQTERVRQRFYEISCMDSVRERPCRYLDRHHAERSRCVQQYSYSYALVRDRNASGERPWRLDYILVRSGCSCHVNPE